MYTNRTHMNRSSLIGIGPLYDSNLKKNIYRFYFKLVSADRFWRQFELFFREKAYWSRSYC